KLGQEKLDAAQEKDRKKKQMIEEKEKIAAIINTYQRNVQIAEKKNVKLQQEMIDLQIQMNQLLAKQSSSGGGDSALVEGKEKE
ncbi:hypothetical protein, partial [Klebsiella pneumoniae]|uniref:hypothetical protein n=1 Tax=Klebsiella pneumoniae TaxID=573 RepID=UPI003854C4A7